MRKVTILGAAVLCMSVGLSGCWSEPEVTGSTNSCVANLYSRYNPKVMEQCVNACIKCDRGNIATCTTSCTLKGAR